MADVTGRERGQMLLIGSLVVATSFVGLALVVNDAIYAENLSTRETSGEAERVAETQQLAVNDLRELIDRSNAAVVEDNFSAVENGYNDDLAVWSDSLERQYQRTGRFVEYRPNETVEGTHIQQTNASRNFTAGGSVAGTDEWTLVDDTTRAGEFELTVDRTSLLVAPAALALDTIFGETFNVVIEDEIGRKWVVYLFQDDSPVSDATYVVVKPPGGFDFDPGGVSDPSNLVAGNYCTSTGENVSLDLVEGTFDGEECSDLSFYTDDVTGTSHSISYRNTKTGRVSVPNPAGPPTVVIPPADRVTGTYNFTVDTRADRTPYYAPTSGDDPNAKAVIYGAGVDVEFRSGSVVYRNENLRAKWSEVT
ncbi:hypothetical protein BRD02_02525 [Halobacteriales archaeon QS_8_69_73]|nr:MAG: hypothetical protein BRD02_02525 [Halobacteriales archaeon QS_8_69_73]